MRIFIGTIIIVIGIGLLASLVYFIFIKKTPISEIIDSVPIPGRQTQVEPDPSAISDSISGDTSVTPGEGTEPRRIVVIEDQEQNQAQTPAASSGEFGKEDLMRMAASFTERFGSYSNQSNFSNIIDLRIFMSQKMKKWADSYVESERIKDAANDIYYGITTKAIAKDLKEYDDDLGRARVTVMTRRREATVTTGNFSNVIDQNIEIYFIRENGVWKVDNALWEPEP
jgi:hypothetical protein